MIISLNSSFSKDIWELIRDGVPENLLQTTIYSSPKSINYLSTLMDKDPSLSGYLYRGYLDKEKLVAFTEWRSLQDSLFLNNIYVDGQYRGSGLGKILFKEGLKQAKSLDKSSICLDVFRSNENALQWYKKIGFKEIDNTHLLELKLESININSIVPYQLVNWPQSELILENFGFSQLNFLSDDKHYNVGVLNNKYYRITDQEYLLDDRLLNSLVKNDPQRNILYLSKVAHIENNFSNRLIDEVIRMELLIN